MGVLRVSGEESRNDGIRLRGEEMGEAVSGDDLAHLLLAQLVAALIIAAVERGDGAHVSMIYCVLDITMAQSSRSTHMLKRANSL